MTNAAGRVPENLRAPARAELARRRHLAETVGGKEAIDRQHRHGMLTAPERVDLLLDPGSHVPFGTLVHGDDLESAERTFGDGELAGFGRVDGRWVAYFASDPRVKGASGTPATFRHSDSFRAIVERASLPLFHLMQGGGARMTDAMSSRFLAFPGTGLGARRAFPRRGVLITAVLGAYYAPWTAAQADWCVATRSSNLSLTAPALLAVGTGEQMTAHDLGGAELHATISGQLDALADDEPEAIAMARRVFAYLPAHAGAAAPTVASGDSPTRQLGEVDSLVPSNPRRGYDIRHLLREVVDRDSLLEFAASYAKNMVTGLARMDGETVVILANNPLHVAGVVDTKAVIKATKATRLAADFGLPLVSFVDTPGVLPTRDQEMQRLMSMLYDYAALRLTVEAPKVVLIVRKAIGFALQAMSAGDPEAHTMAWPDAQIAFTGPEAAARVTYRQQIDAADDVAAVTAELSARFDGRTHPWEAAHLGYLDDVIRPASTRASIVAALGAGRPHRVRTQ